MVQQDVEAATISTRERDRERPCSVLFLAPQFSPCVGGSEVAALREAQALRARGHDVRVLTIRWNATWPQEEMLEGVPVKRIGGLFLHGRLRVRFGAKWLAEALLWLELLRCRRTYEVIHVRLLGWTIRPTLVAAWMAGKPLIIRLSGAGNAQDAGARSGVAPRLYAGTLDPESPFLRVPFVPTGGDINDLLASQWLAPWTLWLLRRRNVTFTAISTRIRSQLIQYGFRPEQIVLLPNGIDPDAYIATASQVRARAQRQGSGPPLVLCIANYQYQKGPDILLHAWQNVHAFVPSARMLLVGTGELRDQLERLAGALGLSEYVQFIGPLEDVRLILARSDIFVLPSRHEGLPNALLEAMAAGLPCVATRVSGSEDLIVDGESGLLVPPEDPYALATALLLLLRDHERARAMGEAGRERVTQAFQHRQLIERLRELYAAVLAR